MLLQSNKTTTGALKTSYSFMLYFPKGLINQGPLQISNKTTSLVK